MEELPGPSGALVSAPTLTPDEKTWAALAHASVLLAVLSGGPFGPIAAFIIWLIKKDQSAFVGRQAMQSLIYQLIVVVLAWSMWFIVGLLSIVLVGLCCIPFALLISLAFVVYGCYAAYECSLGHDFSYWLIGDMIR